VGVTVPAAVMLIGVLNYVVPEQVFVWVISVATVGALRTWAMILIAHMGYCKAVAEGRAQPSSFRMPGSPVTNWIALAFIALVTLFLTLDPGTRVALYIGPVWFGILALGYRLTKSRELAVA
jgi:amino acid transporter, AAT family